MVAPPQQTTSQPPGQPLSPSQKRRLRRKKQQAAVPGYANPPPSALPMSPESEVRDVRDVPHLPPYVQPTTLLPGTDPRAARLECEAHLEITLPDQQYPDDPYRLTLTCPLRPWPHPNQPHVVELPAHVTATPEHPRLQAFLCWWEEPPPS